MGWSTAQTCEFPSGGRQVAGYLGQPARPGRHPAVIVLHGKLGFTPQIARVVERLGDEGFVGLGLHWQDDGADPPDDAIMRVIGDACRYLQAQEYVDGDRLGIAGYCRGGGLAILALEHHPLLRAGVSFHGYAYCPEPSAQQPDHPYDLAERLTAPLLLLHGMSDPIYPVETMFRFAQRLNELEKPFELKVYGGVRHVFTLPGYRDYDPLPAADAWAEASRFLHQTLGG